MDYLFFTLLGAALATGYFAIEARCNARTLIGAADIKHTPNGDYAWVKLSALEGEEGVLGALGGLLP